MISSVDLEQLPGLWPGCSANKQPGINWLSIPSTWASSFLVKCCCRLHMTTPCKYIQMQSPCSACRFMHPIKASFSLWAELQCSRKSSKPRQRTEVVSPVQDSSLRPVLEQRHWSEKPPKSAPFAKPQWSWVRPTTEKAILAQLATCTGFKDLYNVEEQSLSQISSITNPRWGNSKTKVRKSNICTIKHKSM